jgi:hypothetical protein
MTNYTRPLICLAYLTFLLFFRPSFRSFFLPSFSFLPSFLSSWRRPNPYANTMGEVKSVYDTISFNNTFSDSPY